MESPCDFLWMEAALKRRTRVRQGQKTFYYNQDDIFFENFLDQ
jgi:hypothetical protein